MSLRDRVICTSCNWEGTDGELISEQTFAGNREEPAEYIGRCPSCNGKDEDCIQEDRRSQDRNELSEDLGEMFDILFTRIRLLEEENAKLRG